MPAKKLTPLPCPFCGKAPVTEPDDPTADGDAWGAVMCVNKRCSTYGWPNGNHGVRVLDGVDVADSRGSDAYKQAAIRRWNKRAQ